MNTPRRDLRSFAMIPLAIYLVVAGISLLFFNPISQQNQFAALLASEFVTISIMIYVSLHKDFGKLGAVWFALWWLFLAVMLSVAFF